MGESERTVETGIFRNEYASTPISDPKAFMAAFAAHNESPTWQELDVGIAKYILDDSPFADSKDRHSEADREARDLLDYFQAYETARNADQTTNASECAYHVGQLAQRLRVRLMEEPAKVGRESLVMFRGKWIKVPPLHRLILEYVGDRESVSMTELVRDVWDEKYQPIDNRYKQAIFKLNKSLRTKDKSLPQFSIEGDNLVVVK